jgi:hypothetical protein
VISLNLFFDSKIECFYNDITQIFNRDAVFQFVSWRPLDEDPHPSVIDIVVQLWRTWDGLTLAKRFINCGRADIRRFLGKFVTCRLGLKALFSSMVLTWGAIGLTWGHKKQYLFQRLCSNVEKIR